eukprot:CAMPEP_0181444108 /NCGR_PEP_ID=MMETSP1110-20121109/24896_1 /TAXON_ID=174948 /ORGANISM="Symbiodinium sp., Strain CCMP421" /LENGTH=168 /DNA_ID=CAMNT_0023568099 /DNA_START=183 /DNA_END=689 /DNA_ORIENTATION=-
MDGPLPKFAALGTPLDAQAQGSRHTSGFAILELGIHHHVVGVIVVRGMVAPASTPLSAVYRHQRRPSEAQAAEPCHGQLHVLADPLGSSPNLAVAEAVFDAFAAGEMLQAQGFAVLDLDNAMVHRVVVVQVVLSCPATACTIARGAKHLPSRIRGHRALAPAAIVAVS